MRYRASSTTVILLLITVSASNAQEGAIAAQDSEDIPFLLTYPNLDNPDGEVLLDNEHVVVQRYVVPPGEWEGLHAHPGNQVYVHVVGGVLHDVIGEEAEPARKQHVHGQLVLRRP